MKNILITLVLAISFGTQLSSSDPVIEKCCPIVVSSPEVDFAYDVELYSKFFAPAYFNEETNALHYEANNRIDVVSIYDETGSLKYKLPVMSNKVRISKNMFDKGDYKVEFNISDEPKSLVTYVTIN